MSQPDLESALCDGARLRAIEMVGLGSSADPEMDRFAGWVQKLLGVPTALVSLVQPEQQVFPGMAGLPSPFDGTRSTPLSHSLCQYVVASARPLVITDARTDDRVRDNLAIPDLGVVAYAGMPLTDDEGNVLGSLSAIDRQARDWSDDELTTLRDLARWCSGELRLRLTRHDADAEEDRRDRLEAGQRRAFDHSQMLLAASQAFANTSTVADVRDRIAGLLADTSRPTSAEVVLRDRRGRLQCFPLGASPTITPVIDDRMPSATAIREQRLVHYDTRELIAAHHPPEVAGGLTETGLQTIVATPIPGATEPAGAIVVGWDVPDAVDPEDLVVIATIAGYAGHALIRARTLEHRIAVAQDMQDAMLTVLPQVDGLSVAARYSPADSRLDVGGDWYDAVRVGHPGHPGTEVLTLSVGDIIGHDVPAVTLMGQVRSMLRQAAWDHPGARPSEIMGAFETANRGLGIGATGTAVLVHLYRSPGNRWLMRWTNAGHPPPILLLPDGRTELLTEHGTLFGFSFTDGVVRQDHERVVEPGTAVVLYTDGLVERTGSDIDAGTEALLAALEPVRDRSAEAIVDAAMRVPPDDVRDDVVAFAVRFLPP